MSKFGDKIMYPRIIINKKHIIDNCRLMIKKAHENHIDQIMAIIKVFAGHLDILEDLVDTGINQIGDSRLENLKLLKDITIPKCLVRIPMISEVDDVVTYTDMSLNSELRTIQALNNASHKQNKIHQIILMFDLGDLREGIYYTNDYMDLVKEILSYKSIELKGIGTNLTCYGGLVPSKNVLDRLVHIKNNIEGHFNMKLDIISGGNSSTVFLFDKDQIPKEINHLRLGESIFFGKETAYSTEIKGFNHDNFILEAEIIESYTKPSYPDGHVSINSFGEKVAIEDKGLMKRGILAIGKQDVIFDNLKPLDKHISIIGGSSDHCIIDLGKETYRVGDIVRFSVNYPGLLHLMNSNYVNKVFK